MSFPRDERGRLEPELMGDYYDQLEAEREAREPARQVQQPEIDDLPEGWR